MQLAMEKRRSRRKVAVAVQSMKCIWSHSTFLWLVNISLECYRRTVQGMPPILSFFFSFLFLRHALWDGVTVIEGNHLILQLLQFLPWMCLFSPVSLRCSFPASDKIEQYHTVFRWPKILTAPQRLCKLASLCQSSYLLLPFVSDCLSFVCKMLFCSTIATCWLLFSLLIHLGLF